MKLTYIYEAKSQEDLKEKENKELMKEIKITKERK
jgi:hypothetical protein